MVKTLHCGLNICSRCGGNVLKWSDNWVSCLQCGKDYTPKPRLIRRERLKVKGKDGLQLV
jgi:hypothetical protein